MIEQSLYTLLSNSSTIQNVAGNRVYPLLIPEDSPLPALDYKIVAGSTTQTLTTNGTCKYRLEVNCYGSTYFDAVNLRMAVVTALNGYLDPYMSVRFLSPMDLFDHELLQYRAVAEFYVYFTYGYVVPNVVTAPTIVRLTALTAISQWMVVAASNGTVTIADNTNLGQLGDVVGIATAGAVQGSTVQIQSDGAITYSGWNWTQNQPIFLGTNGLLTQTPPTAPTAKFLQVIATPTSATSLIVNVEAPIVLN